MHVSTPDSFIATQNWASAHIGHYHPKHQRPISEKMVTEHLEFTQISNGKWESKLSSSFSFVTDGLWTATVA